MEVSRSGYYRYLKKCHQKPVDKDFRLLSEVRHIHQTSRGTYGSRRMMKSLRAAVYSVEALRMAYWRQKPAEGLIHHSDRGSQYAAYEKPSA